jgi:hypothetical protein
MPCYMQRTTSLEVEAANVAVMAKALEALGLTITNINHEKRAITASTADGQRATWANGVLQTTGQLGFDADAVRREYSRQSIVTTAKAQGWQLRFQRDGTIEAIRRRFA